MVTPRKSVDRRRINACSRDRAVEVYNMRRSDLRSATCARLQQGHQSILWAVHIALIEAYTSAAFEVNGRNTSISEGVLGIGCWVLGG